MSDPDPISEFTRKASLGKGEEISLPKPGAAADTRDDVDADPIAEFTRKASLGAAAGKDDDRKNGNDKKTGDESKKEPAAPLIDFKALGEAAKKADDDDDVDPVAGFTRKTSMGKAPDTSVIPTLVADKSAQGLQDKLAD